MPDVVPFDSSLSQQPDHPVVWLRGCPSGFFTQFVGPGQPGAAPAPIIDVAPDGQVVVTPNPSSGTWVRCRLMQTTTPETLQSESGLTPQEATRVFTEAVQDTARSAGGVLASVGEFGKWAVLGLVALAVLAWQRR